MDNKYSDLAEVEQQIAELMHAGHNSSSPQMIALQAKRATIAAKVAPNIATMTLIQLKTEQRELRALIKKQRRNPLLCDATLSMLKRRNLALKDAIKHNEQELSGVQEAA